MAVISSAVEADYEEIAGLVNAAYRGGENGVGWTHEQHLVKGPRTSRSDIEHELSAAESSVILCLREAPHQPIRACVLVRKKLDHCYLGMLSVAPEAQERGFGGVLLEQSESFARNWGMNRMVMTVLAVRHELLAWYERRGYRQTGESIPFPYQNKNLGKPLRSDLTFVVLEKRI